MKASRVALAASVAVAVVGYAGQTSLDQFTTSSWSWVEPLAEYMVLLGLTGTTLVLIWLVAIQTKRALDRGSIAAVVAPADHWTERRQLELSVLANVSA